MRNADQSGKLKAYWGQIHNFVNAPSGSQNHNGSIEIKRDGVLELSTNNGSAVALNNFDFNDKLQMGQITVQDGATIAADKMLVDRALKKGKDASQNWSTKNVLNLKADTLQLKESGSSTNIDYGFKKATVKNLELTAFKGDSTFNLKNKIDFINTEETLNPYGQDLKKPVVAGKGTINRAVKLENGGSINVAAGDITAQGLIEVSGGDLTIGSSTHSDEAKGVNASLKAQGGMYLWNTKSTTIKIHGNGEQEIATGNKAMALQRIL